MFNIAKLVNKYFKVKFKNELVCIILSFIKNIQHQICIMKNILYGQQINTSRMTSSLKPRRTLLAKKVVVIYKLLSPLIFPFFNFICSSYICLGVKYTRVVGFSFISKEYLFVTQSCIAFLSYHHGLQATNYLLALIEHHITPHYNSY